MNVGNWRVAASVIFAFAVSLPAWPADWNPRLAAVYLDQRQEQWAAWPVAKAPGGTCISCHTGMTYLLARPMLRKALGETEPTTFETNLLEGLRTRQTNDQSMFPGLQKEPLKSQARNVEAALAALLLGPSNKPAWDGGPDKGQWGFHLNLDPWESENSGYFSATMVAIGAGRAGDKAPALVKYLKREFPNQPLHHKVMALWAGVLDKSMRAGLLEDIWKLQAPDGGWTDEALGPWKARPAKPDSHGASSAYATALITFALQQAGAGCSDPRPERARKWLKAHQNAETGAWSSLSMNKKFPADSMQIRFMDDAATGFAVMALLDQGRCAGSTNVTF